MLNGKWIYEKENQEIWYCDDEFDTKEEAIAAGREFFKAENENGNYEDYEYFDVGKKVIPQISTINAEGILETIAENMFDDVGEVAEDYLRDVKGDHLNILEQRLNEVLLQWMDEFKYKPTFFQILDTFKVPVEEEN